MVDLVKLEELAKAATPLDLSTAQKVRDSDEIVCPTCDGDGCVPAKDWCNIDGHAIGIQVYGIGDKMVAAENYLAFMNPATALELKAELTEARKEIARLNGEVTSVFTTSAEIVGSLKAELDAKDAEIARLREALTPSGDTRAAYIGEFSFSIPMVNCEDDEEYMQPVNVPWATIKEIMKAISTRADRRAAAAYEEPRT